jgi:hypothetical protein
MPPSIDPNGHYNADPALPITYLRCRAGRRSLNTERMLATLSGGFSQWHYSLLVGFGVMSFVVTQRRGDGVRRRSAPRPRCAVARAQRRLVMIAADGHRAAMRLGVGTACGVSSLA